MIKVKRTKYYAIVSGTDEEMRRLDGLAGATLQPGDKFGVIPAHHHVHRNPIRKPLIRHLVDKEAGK